MPNEPDEGAEAGETVNKGPYGSGPYRNANNSLADGCYTEETEATNMTGDTMAQMPVVDNSRSLSTSTAAADEKAMRGGN